MNIIFFNISVFNVDRSINIYFISVPLIQLLFPFSFEVTRTTTCKGNTCVLLYECIFITTTSFIENVVYFTFLHICVEKYTVYGKLVHLKTISVRKEEGAGMEKKEEKTIERTVQKTAAADRRVIRTKRSIRMALTKLLASKPLGEITVTELSKAADINRKTFYNYYGDVSMVVEEIEDEIAADFASAINNIDFLEISREPSDIFLRIARLIEKDLEFYARVFAAEGQTSLLQKIVAPLKQQLWESFADQIGPEAEGFEFLLEYTISGMIAVYQRWFNTGRKQDIEELSRNLSILTFKGINGLSGK